jgi:hypothetical protein
MKVIALVLASLSVATPALAEPPGLTPPGLTPPPPSEMKTFGSKSETIATGLTVAGTVLPMLLFGAALSDIENDDGGATVTTGLLTVPGPAIGHWYTNHVGTYGMAARLVAMGFVGSGFSDLAALEGCKDGRVAPYYCQDLDRQDAKTMINVGFAIYAGSWIHDLVTSRREVRRYNAARTFAVAPTFAPGATGFAVAGAF